MDVVNAGNTAVTVGKADPAASVRLGDSPVRIGWGLGGLGWDYEKGYLLALLALAACGADGEPVQPTLNAYGGVGSSGGYVGGAVG